SAFVDRDHPSRLPSMPQADAVARLRQPPLPRLRPFDERDRVVEVRLEVAPLGRRHAGEAIEVEMGDLALGAVVAVADRVRRAGDALAHAERDAGAANERRLPRAELAGDGDD